jgi:hypothetical protein
VRTEVGLWKECARRCWQLLLYNLPTAQRDVLNACEVGPKPNQFSSVSNDCDLLSRSSFPTYPWCAPLLPPTHPVDARRTVCTSSVRRAHTPAARQELPGSASGLRLPGLRRLCFSCAVSPNPRPSLYPRHAVHTVTARSSTPSLSNRGRLCLVTPGDAGSGGEGG